MEGQWHPFLITCRVGDADTATVSVVGHPCEPATNALAVTHHHMGHTRDSDTVRGDTVRGDTGRGDTANNVFEQDEILAVKAEKNYQRRIKQFKKTKRKLSAGDLNNINNRNINNRDIILRPTENSDAQYIAEGSFIRSSKPSSNSQRSFKSNFKNGTNIFNSINIEEGKLNKADMKFHESHINGDEKISQGKKDFALCHKFIFNELRDNSLR